MLYIPRDTLDAALPQPMRLHGLSPDNACAHLLAPQELPVLPAAATLLSRFVLV
ncbi:hypothetical protein QTI66_25095 [Variovorax sp. J22R133]|uniref:hypothetical protein n=1 Tax=Variovorax brevis TaxID=3053503 RepID=UPI0025788F77|nr:hypothetical protein [Variovorax sp. J22R133]MDM0115449.1 hypothetical protein [Variovorax sp. J22R133]